MSKNITESIKGFVIGIVKLIVDKPDEVDVFVTTTTKSILVQIKVDKKDIGKVIGKKGRTIDALKLITTVVKNTQFLGDVKDVFIEIMEDEKSNFLREKNLKKL